MKNIVTLFLTIVCGISLLAQDKIILKTGETINGRIIQKNDSLLVIKTKRVINSENVDVDLVFYNTRIKQVLKASNKKDGDKVNIKLVGGKNIYGRLIDENLDNIVIVGIRGSDIDTLILKKRQIENIKFIRTRAAFVDIGFLRGGALIGAELELVINQKMTLFLGSGYKGYSGGLNIYFNDDLSGFGLKSAYVHQGFGNSYAGSLFTNGFTYKSDPGLTLDLGIAYVSDTGNYNYGGRKIILSYGIGLRF